MVVKTLCLLQGIIKADLRQTIGLARGVSMRYLWSSSNHLPSAVLDKLFANVSHEDDKRRRFLLGDISVNHILRR